MNRGEIRVKQKVQGVFIIFISCLLVACGSQSSQDQRTTESTKDMSVSMSNTNHDVTEMDKQAEVDYDPSAVEDRKIIQKAYLNATVDGLRETSGGIEERVKKLSGYVVDSNFYSREKSENVSLAVRIPEDSFQPFLDYMDEIVEKMIDRTITGEDVTAEYVDLESRLKSKQVVEKRLLTFMENAEKTEDLLQISNELAQIQEEIEVLTGKMKYIENQSAYATVEIHLSESNVDVPNIAETKLNTWDKTKKQFSTSINALLAIGSSIIVFILGNVPVIALILILFVPVYLFIRKRWKE